MKFAFVVCLTAVLSGAQSSIAGQDGCWLAVGGFPGATSKSTGNPGLDAKFNQEGNFLYSVLHVRPNMFVFNDGRHPNAFASPKDTLTGYSGTVYFGMNLLKDELWRMDKGEIAVAGIMAHEFAHILQFERETRFSIVKQRELHADFLAGYYLAKKAYLKRIHVEGFARSLYEKGRYDFWDPNHHGTPEERVEAMKAGFRQGTLSLDAAYGKGLEHVGFQNDEEKEHISFSIAIDPIRIGEYGAIAKVDIDDNRVGKLNNMDGPYDIEADQDEGFQAGSHPYKVVVDVYVFDSWGNRKFLKTIQGSGSIWIKDGDTLKVGGDLTGVILKK